MSLSGRIGQFLLFISLILLIIFFATDQARHPAYTYCCSGVLILILAVLLIWRGKTPPPETSARFGLLRRLRGEEQDQDEEREEY
jgi:uncharacterized membrane protein YqjE